METNVNICDVCTEIFAGGDAPKGRISQVQTEEYPIPIYSNGEDKSGLYGFTDVARVEQPSVTVSARGTIGYTAIRTEPFLPIVRLITLVPDQNKINIKYLYYAIQNYKFEGSGTSIPQLTVPMLKKYNFPLPVQETQTKVVATLDKVNELIALRKEQLAKLDQLVKSRFIELFGDPLGNPLGWVSDNMKGICTKITDGEHGSVARIDSGNVFLNAKHIKKDGTIDWKTVTYTSDEVHNKIYARCNPEPGDVLLTTTGTIGNVAIVPDVAPFSMDRGITLLKLNRAKVNSIFVAALLGFECIQDVMNANVHASAIGHLFLNKVMQIPVIVPPIELQNQFATFVKQTDKSKLAVQQSLDKLQELKKALMQKYFG